MILSSRQSFSWTRWPGTIPSGKTCSELATAMDLLPTFAGLARGEAPQDRIIDGKDISPLLENQPGSVSPHEQFFYFRRGILKAVRVGRWKLHVHDPEDQPDAGQVNYLFDLERDIGEVQNVYEEHPDIVKDLNARIASCREDLGDGASGATGKNCRPVGKVSNPKPLGINPGDPHVKTAYD